MTFARRDSAAVQAAGMLVAACLALSCHAAAAGKLVALDRCCLPEQGLKGKVPSPALPPVAAEECRYKTRTILLLLPTWNVQLLSQTQAASGAFSHMHGTTRPRSCLTPFCAA